MDLQSLGPGDVLADKFRLDSLLGQGGMGSVWRAHHLTLNSPVALKLIDPSLAVHPDARARFMREAQAAAALRSPHVVQTFDFGLHDDIPYIAMELLDGETLADRLDPDKAVSPALAAQVMNHVARAMSKAHEAGIVHRNLKPDNVFLVPNDDEEIAKVLDFGVAKATGATSLGSDSNTRTGALLGTPYYMSPEQAQGDKTVDWRSDLWSMAIITYESLLGHRPFDSDGLGNLLVQICVAPVPVPSQRGPVPPGFDEWFARATARDPAERFQSAREFAQTLRVALTGESGRSSQVSSPAFDASGRPINPGSYPGIDAGSHSGIGGGSQPGFGSQPGLGSGSHAGTAVIATTEPGASRLTTGGIGAAELDGDPVAIPKKSNAELVIALVTVLLLLGGGVALAVTAIGGGLDGAAATGASSEPVEELSPPAANPSSERVIAPVESRVGDSRRRRVRRRPETARGRLRAPPKGHGPGTQSGCDPEPETDPSCEARGRRRNLSGPKPPPPPR